MTADDRSSSAYRADPAGWGGDGKNAAARKTPGEDTGAGTGGLLLAPWGTPPTPLLPRWYLDALSTVPLPPRLVDLLSYADDRRTPLAVGDLAEFWRRQSRPLSFSACRSLCDLVSEHPAPPGEYVVIPADADLSRLLKCPLSTKVVNSIHRGSGKRALQQGQPVTVAHLLALPDFDAVSLLELMCVVEAAADRGLLTSQRCPECGVIFSADGAPESAGPTAAAWNDAYAPMRRILAASAEFYGAETLADAFTCDLRHLMSQLEMHDSFGGIQISGLVNGHTPAESALAATAEFWESLSPVQQIVLEQRGLAEEPLSPAELSLKTGITGSAVSGHQSRMMAALRQSRDIEDGVGYWISFIAEVIRHHAGPVAAEQDLRERISEVFPDGDEPESDNPVGWVARRLLQRDLGYTCSDGVCLDESALQMVEDIKNAAQTAADDTGLLEESDLLGCLPDEIWNRHSDTLIEWSGLHRLSGQLLALRYTAKAQTKAALMMIGHPATREEVAEVCGLNPSSVGSQLSVIKSVARADKTRWGLAEWIDDEYEGIPAEIVQRIEEDCGATTLERLMTELPEKFGVSDKSVRACVGTPKFSLVDGYVSLAESSAITLRPLRDAVHGQTADGLPYWRFTVEGAPLQRVQPLRFAAGNTQRPGLRTGRSDMGAGVGTAGVWFDHSRLAAQLPQRSHRRTPRQAAETAGRRQRRACAARHERRRERVAAQRQPRR